MPDCLLTSAVVWLVAIIAPRNSPPSGNLSTIQYLSIFNAHQIAPLRNKRRKL